MRKLGEQAVVLGAGMAGLLTAGVLSDFYGSVIVVERDSLPADAAPRKGVPQGRHAHMFLSSGTQTLERLLPGILEDLAADGATVCDEGDMSRIRLQLGERTMFNRSEKFSAPESIRLYLASRPFLEYHVRQRVRSIPNVRFLDAHDVIGPVAAVCHRVTGVRVAAHSTGTETTLDADLVVDALGRAARTPAFLETLGYKRPAESRVAASISYSSQLLQLDGADAGDKVTFVFPTTEKPWCGAFLAYENQTMMMTLVGAEGHVPPADLPGLIALTAEIASDSIVTVVSAARPLGDVRAHHYRDPTWRHYEKLRQFPQGLLVIGDAICSVNPINGQGMTLAVLQAGALRDCLAQGDTDLAGRFFAAAATHIGTVWQLNKAFSTSPPRAQRGLRDLIATRLAQWWMDSVLTAAERDIAVTEAVLRVNHLLDPPTRLAQPGFLLRVARRAVGI